MEKNGLKILAICSSPHKGSTYSVLNAIKEDYPNIDYKILMLNDLDFKLCRGCYACVLKGEKYCPLKDDRDMIIEEISGADGTIFASPVYVNQATALMKNLMERLGYLAHRPRFFDKFAMVMATCGMFGATETNNTMAGIFTAFGFHVVTSLELQCPTKSEKEIKYNREKTKKAMDMFITKIKSGERKPPTVSQLTRFNIFKSISSMIKEEFEADYQYYQENPKFPTDFEISSEDRKMAKQNARKMIGDLMKYL